MAQPTRATTCRPTTILVCQSMLPSLRSGIMHGSAIRMGRLMSSYAPSVSSQKYSPELLHWPCRSILSTTAAPKCEPRAPRLGELRLGFVPGGTEAVRRQLRHDHRASDRPHPWVILRHTSARPGDATDDAPPAVDHVPVVGPPRP